MSKIQAIADYIKESVHNPASTLTNLTYILFAILLYGQTNIILVILLFMLGIASTGFHWVRDKCWHKFDIVSIFYVFSTTAGYLALGNWGIPLGLLLGGIGHYNFEKVRSTYIVAFYGGLSALFYYINNTFNDLLFVLMWFALAGACSHIATHFNPHEKGKIYDVFHAIWHIFTGIGIYYLLLDI